MRQKGAVNLHVLFFKSFNKVVVKNGAFGARRSNETRAIARRTVHGQRAGRVHATQEGAVFSFIINDYICE